MKSLRIASLFLATTSILAASAVGQGFSDQNLEIHGFATQAFLVSNTYNYLGMNTQNGSTQWTEAAININDSVNNRLRVGVQLHYTRLGIFGGDTPTIDWALGDFKINDWLGMRAGKVKIKWGLYNDTQDYDPGYLWSLLPETIYGIDIRTTDLSQTGVEFYGRLPLGRKAGKLAYDLYYGYYVDASNDGIMAGFTGMGFNFPNPPGGKTGGFDLYWDLPLRGMKIGGSLQRYDATGTFTGGTYVQPLNYWPTYYAAYTGRRFFSSAQFMRLIEPQKFTVTGQPTITLPFDIRPWFVTGGYHLNEKWQAGAYYTRDTIASGGNNAYPGNYYRDAVVSTRYDFNSNFYGKMEGHFIDGFGAGFYSNNNPTLWSSTSPKKRTNVLIAKIGFTF